MIDSVVKYITGKVGIRGASSGALIGNESDRLKTSTVLSDQQSGNRLRINNDGTLNINISSTVSGYDTLTTLTNSGTAVPNITTIICSFTATTHCLIQRVSVSLDSLAEVTLKINNIPIATKRSYYLDYDLGFVFTSTGKNSLSLSSGDTLTVELFHSRSSSCSYDCSVNKIENPTLVGVETVEMLYNSLSNLSQNTAMTTLLSYSPPPGTVSFIQRVTASSENVARFLLSIGSSNIENMRTGYGSLNLTREYISHESNGLKILPGNTIALKASHSRPVAGDFNASFQILSIGD